MVTGTPGPCVGNIAPIPRLEFSGLCLQDGPLAIRQAVYASVFSAGLSAAASWDRALVNERGVLMAKEFRGKGSHVILGPVVGPLGRSPFGGRNWEGFSPDAYLSGVLVEESVLGIQSTGVQACTKHYIMNEQEIQRNPSNVDGVTIEAISSNVDDRTMHETYLWPFANALRAGTASIMCSYQRINGSYGCQNSKALNGLLKEELGFQGYVMSDWGGTRSGIPAIQAGLDMNMPGGIPFIEGSPSFFGPNVTEGVNNGSLALERLDDMVLRIMTPYYFLEQDTGYPLVDETSEPLNFFPKANYVHEFPLGPLVDVRKDHAAHIRKLGAAGTVLLKNSNNALPLKEPQDIGVFGNDAADPTLGLLPADNAEIGTLAVGGGSGTGRFSYIVSPLEAIKAKGKSYGALVQYITSNAFIAAHGFSHIAPSPPDVCIVFLKSWASEGDDRKTLIAEWDSTAVVEQTAAFCPNTIVVLHGASPNTLPWKDNANVTAILAAHMPGQETGNSIVDILWGDVNPSGKLPYTIANQESDYSKNLVTSPDSPDPDGWHTDFTEGSLIDYKEFDAGNKGVAYEFGFGLSYTSFELSDIQISLTSSNVPRTPSDSAKVLPGGNVELWEPLANVTVTLKNTGGISGATVPQLYVRLPSEAGEGTPVRNLRGFEKVTLDSGGTATVTFPLLRRDLSFWDTGAQTWRLPSASIGVDVGFSSRDLKLNGEITV
ncbi:glycoside hydrolase family 3 protein [Melanomma pulvis-pyrius CBS 109.77]|uniref:Probable beta-glucosidase G n=1 Tax=Melanomma pulvis-pyrius CBS 109.77 TaxID=1314802 RepID=A0A6A6XA77_9PLEO|nr:glycoside hydrolase family 3 protein [Melanomma pulvis-pyrius CBS 109.77]